jgi:hypothetical protein
MSACRTALILNIRINVTFSIVNLQLYKSTNRSFDPVVRPRGSGRAESTENSDIATAATTCPEPSWTGIGKPAAITALHRTGRGIEVNEIEN